MSVLGHNAVSVWPKVLATHFVRWFLHIIVTRLFRLNLLNTKRENVGYTDHTWKNQNGSSNQAAATATNLVDRSFQFEMTSTRHCNICDKRTSEKIQEHIFKLSLPKATPSKEGLPQPEGIQLLLNKTMNQVWPLIRCFDSSCFCSLICMKGKSLTHHEVRTKGPIQTVLDRPWGRTNDFLVSSWGLLFLHKT